MNKFLFKKSAGFSIIGVLTASTIGAITVLGLAQLSATISRTVYRSKKQFNILQLSEEIKQTFQAGAPSGCDTSANDCFNSCTSSLINYSNSGAAKGITIRGSSETGVPAPIYEPGILYKGIRISKLEFKPDSSTEGTVMVHFSLSNDSRERLSAPLFLKMEVTLDDVDSSGKIKRCNYLGSSLAGAEQPGIYDGCRYVKGQKALLGCGGTEDNDAVHATAYGYNSGAKNTLKGKGNSFFGYEAGRDNTLGSNNTFVGYRAGVATNKGEHNTFFGYQAGTSNNTGSSNIVIQVRGGNTVEKGVQASNRLRIGTTTEEISLIAGRFKSSAFHPEVTFNAPLKVETDLPPTTAKEPALLILGEMHLQEKTEPAKTKALEAKAAAEIALVQLLPRGSTGDPLLKVTADMQVEGKKAGGPPDLNLLGELHLKERNTTPTIKAKNISLVKIATTGAKKLTLSADLEVGDTGGSGTALEIQGGWGLTARDGKSPEVRATVTGKKAMTIHGDLKTNDLITNGKITLNSRGTGTTKTGSLSASGVDELSFEDLLNVTGNGTFTGNVSVDNTLTVTTVTTGSLNIPTGVTASIRGSASLGGGPRTTLGYASKAKVTQLGKDVQWLQKYYPPTNARYAWHTPQGIPFHPHGARGPQGRTGARGARGAPGGCRTICRGCYSCGCRSCSSSRVYKKNIKPWTNLEKAIEEIVETPLFTYQYKEDHPNKTRMGVISEELPAHLQILSEGAPSAPDWVSIYGTLWAGIKALTQKLKDLKEKTSTGWDTAVQDLKARFKNQTDLLKKTASRRLKKLKDRVAEFQTGFQKQSQKNLQNRRDLTELKKQLEETLLTLKNSEEELKRLRRELKNVRQKIKEAPSRPVGLQKPADGKKQKGRVLIGEAPL